MPILLSLLGNLFSHGQNGLQDSKLDLEEQLVRNCISSGERTPVWGQGFGGPRIVNKPSICPIFA